MFQRLDLRGTSLTRAQLTAKLPRATVDIDVALESVRPIIDQVRAQGASALRSLAQTFDGVRPEHLRVPQVALDRAEAELTDELREAMLLSIKNNRAGHEAQLPTPTRTTIVPGGSCGSGGYPSSASDCTCRVASRSIHPRLFTTR